MTNSADNFISKVLMIKEAIEDKRITPFYQ
jgi:hypothetical protein